MKTPDSNVLLYAVNSDSPQHAVAADWLERGFDEPGGIAFAWIALLGFIRIATRPGIFPNALHIEDALGVVDDWLHHPHARVLNPTDRHAALLARLLTGAGQGGSLTTDAHLAALAIEHGATLGSFDRDFERFAGLRVDHLPARAVHEPCAS
ncbi:MAG: type II toxin-antitoxin system VapC family toxin [Rhodanobacteraceae bacterium]